ncbi:hypothetical protein GF391_00045 [Candidatus Uhrbacteria bacterium]|nr:hypothetical protein [Candidatus Uhrbacteria bacterium]
MEGKKKKHCCTPCQKIFIGFGAFLGICILIMGGMTLYSYAVQPKPNDVVLEHLHSLQAKDIQGAYDLTAAAFKRNTRFKGFQKFVQKNAVLQEMKTVEILTINEGKTTAEVTGYITCRHDHQIPFTITLTSELDEWRILNIELDTTGHTS